MYLRVNGSDPNDSQNFTSAVNNMTSAAMGADCIIDANQAKSNLAGHGRAFVAAH